MRGGGLGAGEVEQVGAIQNPRVPVSQESGLRVDAALHHLRGTPAFIKLILRRSFN